MSGYEVCVCYLIRQRAGGRREVLLGEKLTGLGIGKVVGPGGKLEAGESALDAIVREVAEETGIRIAPADLRQAGYLVYEFPYKPSWSQNSTVFVAEVWQGEPQASVELAPRWFALDEIPYDSMWHDARFWLPRVLAGETVRARFSFQADNATVAETNLPQA
ncbi:8-oxo-dGTP diphosphatase [Subtercola sp. RTI3]|uniref:8-oxo-dGTP diphosphatase n=1 Tax=Subtercola sp. RTI3 TaxID=3048639 RepID=UPI002B23A3DD|nr:8-oxo-dGTP diphosphatase [Subtercola sp. RTI3]MEA9984914.1 8-oxo-dGTP diphosphatase [Subtercola sp. RTI3]